MTAALAVLWLSLGAGQAVSPQLALVAMLRALTYDSGFDKRGEGPFVICVPVGGDTSAEAQVLKQLEPVAATTLAGRPVRFKEVPAARVDLEGARASAVLLLGELPAPAAEAWAKEATARKLYTLSLDPGRVQGPVLLGVEQVDGKLQLVLNRQAALAVGAQFSQGVLRLAHIVR